MLKAIVNYALKRAGLEQFGVLVGYMRASGWYPSLLSKVPRERDGTPLPWYNYDFIRFLEQRMLHIHKPVRVFEYGCGNSTLWWSKRASQVISVEDNENWHRRISASRPGNVTCHWEPEREAYIDSVTRQGGAFDVIVVDGSHRQRCAEGCLGKLNEGGVLIVDNSDWSSLTDTVAFLHEQGFRQLEFYGVGPCNGHPWGTSVFYRDQNILGI